MSTELRDMSRHIQDTDSRRNFKSQSKHGRLFLENIFNPVHESIETYVSRPDKGRCPWHIPYLETLDTEVITLLCLGVLMDSLYDGAVSSLTLSNRIGEYLVHEINYSVLEEANPVLLEGIRKHRRGARHRAKRDAKNAAANGKFGDVSLVEWSLEDRHKIGLGLLVVIESLGLIQKAPGKRESHKYLWAEGVMSFASDTYEDLMYWNPVWLPLTTRPLGYDPGTLREESYGPSFPPVNFLKSSSSLERIQGELENTGRNLEACNRLGQVPYQLNTNVFEVVKELWTKGYEVGGLPIGVPKEVPQCPPEPTKEQLKAWKSTASKTKIANALAKGKQLYISRQLSVISRLVGEPLYFLWQADSRGRLYPLTGTMLNPQGSDLSKGLLTIHSSKARPIGESGWKALLISAANHYGMDKLSIKDRYHWALDNIPLILGTARSPVERLELWRYCDSPFQFLAAAIEINRALSCEDKYSYESSLPVHLDGKCSGVQHWSLLLKDEETASRVGLVKASESDIVPDLYTDTLVRLLELLRTTGDTQGIEEWWLSRELDRKATKRPTMTYVYSSTRQAWKEHLMEWALDKGYDRIFETSTVTKDGEVVTLSPKKQLSDKVNVLLPYLETALSEVLASPARGMKWLRQCITEITKVSGGVTWITPSGFVVTQEYVKLESNRLQVTVKSMPLSIKVRIDRKILQPTETIDTHKHRSAISPNLIQSLDASHLTEVAISCYDSDIPLTVVHDSFGTIPACVDEMRNIIKYELIEMYSGNYLAQLKNYWESKYSLELPSIPERGRMNIEETVATSSYDFA